MIINLHIDKYKLYKYAYIGKLCQLSSLAYSSLFNQHILLKI